MRWLMIGFLVSLAALLVAAAGVARHIWLHRAQLRRNRAGALGLAVELPEEAEYETDVEIEH